MDFVHDVIAWKRDGKELDEGRVRAFVEGVVSGAVPSYQASAVLMAMVIRGLSDDETLLPGAGHGRQRQDARPQRAPPSRPGQALERRRRRQGDARAGAAGRRLRGRLRQDVGPRPRPHRRHAGQARVDPGLSRAAAAGRLPPPAGAHRRRRGEPERADRARGPAALRVARRDRHGGVRRAHRREHHGQEGRQRHLGGRPRSQGRPRCVRGRPAGGARDRPPLPPDRAGLRAPDLVPLHRHGGAARAHRRQPLRGGGGVAGAGRRGARPTCARSRWSSPPSCCRSRTPASTPRRPERARRRRWTTAVPRSTSSAGATSRAGAGARATSTASPGTRSGRRRRASSRGSTRWRWAAPPSSPAPAAGPSTTRSIRRRGSCSSVWWATRWMRASRWPAVFSRDPARRREACDVLESAFSVSVERPVPRPLVLGREP